MHKGIAHARLKQYQLAIDNYSNAILYEDDKKDSATLYNNRASNERSLKQYIKAIEDDNVALSFKESGEYYWNRALSYQDNKDYQLAIYDFNKAMTYSKNDSSELAILYNNRAINEIALKDFASAIADDSLAISLNPKFGFAYWTKGSAFSNAGLHKLAVQEFEKAVPYYLDKTSALAELYADCASELYNLENYKSSLNYCNLSIGIDSAYANPHFVRGKLYLKKLNDHNAAQKDFKLVLAQDTSKTSIEYIFSLFYTGDFQNAVNLLKKRILTTTSSIDVLSDYYNMACLLSLMNSSEDAVTYLKIAIDKGYPKKFALTDDDLDNIKNTTYFKSIQN